LSSTTGSTATYNKKFYYWRGLPDVTVIARNHIVPLSIRLGSKIAEIETQTKNKEIFYQDRYCIVTMNISITFNYKMHIMLQPTERLRMQGFFITFKN